MREIWFHVIYILDHYLKDIKLLSGISGFDKHKPNKTEIPESLGFEFGTLFFSASLPRHKEHKKIYLLLFINWLIGFIDDITQISFKIKTLISFSLSIAYITQLTTFDIRPRFIGYILHRIGLETLFTKRFIFFIHIIVLFLITTFTFNSVNLLAGINGIEIVQTTCIITAFQLLISKGDYETNSKETKERIYLYRINETALTISLMIFFLNKYPSFRFVGNSYTAFAGSLLCVNILHNKLPIISFGMIIIQLINFLIGFLEIFQICGYKREAARLPKFDIKTGMLKMGQSRTYLNLLLYLKGEMKENDLLSLFTLSQLFYLTMYYTIRTHVIEL